MNGATEPAPSFRHPLSQNAADHLRQLARSLARQRAQLGHPNRLRHGGAGASGFFYRKARRQSAMLDGPVLFDLKSIGCVPPLEPYDPGGCVFRGSAEVPDLEVANLLANQWYVTASLHADVDVNYTGRIELVPEPSPTALLCVSAVVSSVGFCIRLRRQRRVNGTPTAPSPSPAQQNCGPAPRPLPVSSGLPATTTDNSRSAVYPFQSCIRSRNRCAHTPSH